MTGLSRNATFALHVDIMKLCDHKIAIALAERLGGKDCYELLLAAVKGSLLFLSTVLLHMLHTAQNFYTTTTHLASFIKI